METFQHRDVSYFAWKFRVDNHMGSCTPVRNYLVTFACGDRHKEAKKLGLGRKEEIKTKGC